MTFEQYLTKRRVNVAAFAAAEPQRFAEWQNWFGQMHPESFYMLVKMVLNDVRRNYWLAEVPKPVATPESETAAVAPTRPAGRRAAIARPAATSETSNSEIPAETSVRSAIEILETKNAETNTAETGIPEETAPAKPARPVFKPRAIIKKPTDVSSEGISTSDTPETGKAARVKPEGIPSETAKPETENLAPENPETAPPKPARPRAVIRRPAALTKPEETPEKTVADAAEKIENPVTENPDTVGDSPPKVETETAPEGPKSARPRPVFKRPSATAASEKTAAETEKTLGNSVPKVEAHSAENITENPVAIPGQEGASETKAVSEAIHQNPEAAKAAEEVAAAAGHVPKPPRPRPVFKRPASTTNNPENSMIPENAADAEKTVPESEQKLEPAAAAASELTPEKRAETVENLDPKPKSKTQEIPEEKGEAPAAKPVRPRPIFKRSAKPESDGENPQPL